MRYDDKTGPNTDITSSDQWRSPGRDCSTHGIPQRPVTNLSGHPHGQLVSQVNIYTNWGIGRVDDGGLFTATGTTAGTISMALTDRQKIAASSTAAGVPGNNVNALALGIYRRHRSRLGKHDVSATTVQWPGASGATPRGHAGPAGQQEILHDQLLAHRAEVSGVSMDEELINMLKYQRAFQAASKLITTSDEMPRQTILSETVTVIQFTGSRYYEIRRPMMYNTPARQSATLPVTNADPQEQVSASDGSRTPEDDPSSMARSSSTSPRLCRPQWIP